MGDGDENILMFLEDLCIYHGHDSYYLMHSVPQQSYPYFEIKRIEAH